GRLLKNIAIFTSKYLWNSCLKKKYLCDGLIWIRISTSVIAPTMIFVPSTALKYSTASASPLNSSRKNTSVRFSSGRNASFGGRYDFQTGSGSQPAWNQPPPTDPAGRSSIN